MKFAAFVVGMITQVIAQSTELCSNLREQNLIKVCVGPTANLFNPVLTFSQNCGAAHICPTGVDSLPVRTCCGATLCCDETQDCVNDQCVTPPVFVARTVTFCLPDNAPQNQQFFLNPGSDTQVTAQNQQDCLEAGLCCPIVNGGEWNCCSEKGDFTDFTCCAGGDMCSLVGSLNKCSETIAPTTQGTAVPTEGTAMPTAVPSAMPTAMPVTQSPGHLTTRTQFPTRAQRTHRPTTNNHVVPTSFPTKDPPTAFPTKDPRTAFPTKDPPTAFPTKDPPTRRPTKVDETNYPTKDPPTSFPTKDPPTSFPTKDPPTGFPTKDPPTAFPTKALTSFPTRTLFPTRAQRTHQPTTQFPTKTRTQFPTPVPETRFPTVLGTQYPTHSERTHYPTDTLYPTPDRTLFPTTDSNDESTQFPTQGEGTHYPTNTLHPTPNRPTGFPTRTFRPTPVPRTHFPTTTSGDHNGDDNVNSFIPFFFGR